MAIDLYKNRCSVYEGEKPYIFVSYSHRDIEKVVKLIRQLQSLGFRIWYDSGVPAGAEWPEEIATHLKNSGCVLSLLSANAAESRHFKEEFNYAYHLKKPILVAYLEDCKLTPGIEMRVVSQQCIKCEHCENDDDLLAEIARAQILLPCLVEKPDSKPETPATVSVSKLEAKAPKTEIALLREKAEKGDVQAQYKLGQAYDFGRGVEQNYSEAAHWYQQSANQGHRDAQFSLGYFYEYGQGVHIDLEEAVNWYRKSADQRNTTALIFLGKCYEYGKGVDTNAGEAFLCYKKAADLGNANAQNLVGYCFDVGLGVPQDLEKALFYYMESAKNGEAYSQCNLAYWYEVGKSGVMQDWNEAVRWYRKAAEQGHSFAQKKMAELYNKGLGVPMDKAEAERWQKLYDENPDK